MTMDLSSARPLRRAIVAMLWVQLGIGAILIGGDVLSGLSGALSPSNAPELDAPVAPGDQTRRYDPSRIMTNPDRRVPFPGGDDLPSRLAFEAQGTTASIRGSIAEGDGDRFVDWLALQSGLETVRLMSPGGSVYDALQIGGAIRKAGLDTTMLAGDFCYSACPYILAGGVERQVDIDASVGVHQHYFDENTVLPAFVAVEDIQRGQAEVVAYLSEMGIDLRITQHALSTPPDEIYVLLPEELREYRMVTTD